MRKKHKQPLTVKQKIKRRNFISFGIFIGLNVTAYGIWHWLANSPRETKSITGGAKEPFRKALNKTELAFRKIYSRNHLVKTYQKSEAAKSVRVNGHLGLKSDLVVSDWILEVKSSSGAIPVTMNELRSLPKTELIFDFKCVEGWDQIQHWAGVRLIDFMDHYKLHSEAKMEYMGFETPDKAYYVGIDMESALHPQTIMAYEMNDTPLTNMHGAPLRLIIPVKYGIKNLKRIGTITFSNQRPPDYWAERGYDYYSGL